MGLGRPQRQVLLTDRLVHLRLSGGDRSANTRRPLYDQLIRQLQVRGAVENTSDGWRVELQRTKAPSLYGGDYQSVVFQVVFHTDTIFRFMVYGLNVKCKWGKTVDFFRQTVELIRPTFATLFII